ncbi:MAG: DEAD/DEAH box helicase family protein [Armatimonadetes bacterium]|nr:DEAD/DEAH box helicase family protein [Armatimonadota bacterium]
MLASSSYLEAAFVRWVLTPAVEAGAEQYVVPQQIVFVDGHRYRIDYELVGSETRIAVELDGFEFHGTRCAFTYDRLRQNDLAAAGRIVVRFSYEAIRAETARCVAQLQSILKLDPLLRNFVVDNPIIEIPDMPTNPLEVLLPQRDGLPMSYFDSIRTKINQRTLRSCQTEAFAALGNYFLGSGRTAACVMSVGAGKTALGVTAVLAFTRQRALVVTPGSVIRGTFDRAFDHQAVGNSLYGLPNGPIIPGCRPPTVLTLDREDRAIRSVSREQLLNADVIITNFHSLGTGEDPDDLLTKLSPTDIDLIIVDEAHIAAAESYQRLFRHFEDSKAILLSACFQRLDGKPIDADVIYRYRLIDSIADGNAKNLRVQRFSPEPEQTIYEMVWPDGSREEIQGKAAILELIRDEKKLSAITARSHEPIRQIMRAVRVALDRQTQLLFPIKPRVLFSALGERHAEQIAAIAEEHGIPCSYLHHSMTESRIRSIRGRYEQESGDLQGIVQLRMLGQGYDFPPITVVVPMRPYASFSEFYQFVGRGIRVLSHASLVGRVNPQHQFLDIIYHAELGLDEHIDTIYLENDMDPLTSHIIPMDWNRPGSEKDTLPIAGGRQTAERPEAFVLFQPGEIEQRIVHDGARVEQRREEREVEALAQRYAVYAQSTSVPVTFDQFVEIMRNLRE